MWDEIKFRVKGYFEQNSWKRLLFWAFVWGAITYFVVPKEEVTTSSQANAPEKVAANSQQSHLDKSKVAKRLMGVPTDEDLRVQMTTYQSHFYWQSFNQMMTFANANQKADFNDEVISLTILAGEQFESAKGMLCRPYAEEIIMAGKKNQNKGFACQIGPQSWCRFEGDEKAKCHYRSAEGLGGFKDDLDIQLHNLGVDWKRNIRNLPAF